MKAKGLKKCGTKPETVKTKSGNILETGEKIPVFRSPDGTKGTMEFFNREFMRGRLHGCLLSF